MSVAERFGQNLRLCRRRTGLSQEAVSLRASIHRTEVGMLERGERTPKIDTLVKVAGAVGVDPGDLLVGLVWESGEARPGCFRPD